jgi:hypothetical protein
VHGHWWEGTKRIAMTLGQLIAKLATTEATFSPVIVVNPCILSFDLCAKYDMTAKPM